MADKYKINDRVELLDKDDNPTGEFGVVTDIFRSELDDLRYLLGVLVEDPDGGESPGQTHWLPQEVRPA